MPTIFKVAVDNVVRNCLSMTVEDDEIILDGMVHAVGRSMGVFYADDGLIGSRDSKWIQGSLKLLIGLFHWIGLMAKISKSKMMVCQIGKIRLIISEETVGRRSTRKGVTYRDRLHHWLR